MPWGDYMNWKIVFLRPSSKRRLDNCVLRYGHVKFYDRNG